MTPGAEGQFLRVFRFVRIHFNWRHVQNFYQLRSEQAKATMRADMPFVNCNSKILTLGFISFGLRVEFFISQVLFERGSKDFEEMLLHDIVTLLLFFGYLFSNLLPVGTMIAFLHDVSDIPLHVAKMLNASKYSSLVSIPFVTCQLMFLYLRLYFLPILIYYVS